MIDANTLKKELSNTAEAVDKYLDRFLPAADSYPSEVHEAMRYSMMAGGKRLRPVLAFWTADLSDKPVPEEAVSRAACSLEMVHTYSLIHDDLPCMDDDNYRRGKLTCHKVYGEPIALLAGSALFTLAFETLFNAADYLPEADRLRVLKAGALLAEACGGTGLIGGQVVDIISEGKPVDQETVKYIHRSKTMALIRVSCRIGALLGGLNDAQYEAVSNYGECIGIAFQIADDILNVEGDAGKLGKNTGSDADRGKMTYPSAFGLDESKNEMRDLINKAREHLKIFGGKKDRLEALAEFIINRSH